MDYAAAWQDAEPAPRGSGTVRLICVRIDEGEHETPAIVDLAGESAAGHQVSLATGGWTGANSQGGKKILNGLNLRLPSCD